MRPCVVQQASSPREHAGIQGLPFVCVCVCVTAEIQIEQVGQLRVSGTCHVPLLTAVASVDYCGSQQKLLHRFRGDQQIFLGDQKLAV